MNRVLKLGLMLFCLISFVGVSATEAEDDVYYCSADDSTGFAKKDGSWNRTGFTLDRFKFKFVKDSDGKTSIRMAHRLTVRWECSPSWDAANLFCHDTSGGYFSVSLSTGNFVVTEALGWLGDKGTKEARDTVEISRGTCSKF